MKVTLIAITQPVIEMLSDVEDVAEFAGRTCYNAVDKFGNNPAYLQKLIESGHESVIEVVSVSFLIEGVSRSFLAQATRHRLHSYSVESSRYVDQSECDFIIPDSIKNHSDPEVLRDYNCLLAHSREVYKRLRDSGIKKEDARYCLPQSQEVKLVMSGNLRSWRHYIKMRCDKAAQWEIRSVANEILNLLYAECPNIFRDLYKKYLESNI